MSSAYFERSYFYRYSRNTFWWKTTNWSGFNDFSGVIEWFSERVDIILLLFDAHKLDISDEFRSSIEVMKGNEDKIRIVLNKADQVDQQVRIFYYHVFCALYKCVWLNYTNHINLDTDLDFFVSFFLLLDLIDALVTIEIWYVHSLFRKNGAFIREQKNT